MLDSGIDTAPLAANAAAPPRAAPSAWRALAILIAVAFFAFIDRQILVLLTEPIRAEFGLSDTQIGLLQGAGVALFAGVASLPLGWLADRVDRRLVLAACMLVWSGATALCGVTQNFTQLFLATVGLGIGEAGLLPVIYGLLPDLFPARQRVLANAIFALANLLGTGAGMALGGALMQGIGAVHGELPAALAALAPWRLAFFAVALPAPLLVLALAAIRMGNHDSRNGTTGSRRGAESAPAPAAEYFRAEATTMARFFGAIGLINLSFVGVATWMPVVVVRTFGATPAQAGGGMGAAAMLGGVAGCALGGLLARRLRGRYGVLAPLRVCELGALVAAVLTPAYLLADHAAWIYVLFGVQITSVVAGMVLFPTIMQDISPPHLRSRVAAVGVMTSVVVQAGSPVFIGVMSDSLGALPHGLVTSIVAVAVAGFGAACLLLRAAGPGVRSAVQRYA